MSQTLTPNTAYRPAPSLYKWLVKNAGHLITRSGGYIILSFVIFLPIAAFAGRDNIFPFIGTSSAGGQDMIPG